MGILDGHWLYILVILAVVLIFWGPGKLPEVGAGLGRAIREFKKASTNFTETVNTDAPAQQSVVGHATSQETPSTTPAAPAAPAASPETTPPATTSHPQ